MKSLRKRQLISAGLLVLIVLLSACSVDNDESLANLPSPGTSDGGDAIDQTALTAIEHAEAYPAQSEQPTNTQRLIIKDGNLQLEVADTTAASARIADIASRYGGYVLQNTANNRGERRTASVTIAVEAAHFEAAIEDIQALAKTVLSVSTEGTDVTDQYVDAESRLRNLEATRDRIRAFLDQAQNVEEAILVNNELSQIEGEIEQVKGRMNYLAGRAAYSTITINLEETVASKSKKGWSPGSTLRDAIEAQGDLLRILADVAIWLVIVAGPYLAAVGVVFALVHWWRRGRKSQASLPGD